MSVIRSSLFISLGVNPVLKNLVDEKLINWLNFETFVRNQIPGIPDGKLEVKKFTEGYSNQTYSIKIGEWEAVMRRPPFGKIPPRAHDMQREYNLLTKINRVYPLAPKPFVYGEDESIMNRHFYLMEKKDGVVIDDSLPSGFDDSNKYGSVISNSFIDALVQLQSIDCERSNLMDIGKPEGYLERQVHGWIKRFSNSKTDNVTSVKDLEKWLIDKRPETRETTIVHNDFKLNNLIFNKEDISIIEGVLDWEMATIGDPLTDVGATVSYWIQSEDPDLGITAVTNQAGFMTRREFVEAYAQRSGRDVSDITYYVTFGFFKLAAILQQIYHRYAIGALEDERFEGLYIAVNNLVEMAELTRTNRIL